MAVSSPSSWLPVAEPWQDLAIGTLLIALLVVVVAFDKTKPDLLRKMNARKRSASCSALVELENHRALDACAQMFQSFDQRKPTTQRTARIPKSPSMPTLIEVDFEGRGRDSDEATAAAAGAAGWQLRRRHSKGSGGPSCDDVVPRTPTTRRLFADAAAVAAAAAAAPERNTGDASSSSDESDSPNLASMAASARALPPARPASAPGSTSRRPLWGDDDDGELHLELPEAVCLSTPAAAAEEIPPTVAVPTPAPAPATEANAGTRWGGGGDGNDDERAAAPAPAAAEALPASLSLPESAVARRVRFDLQRREVAVPRIGFVELCGDPRMETGNDPNYAMLGMARAARLGAVAESLLLTKLLHAWREIAAVEADARQEASSPRSAAIPSATPSHCVTSARIPAQPAPVSVSPQPAISMPQRLLAVPRPLRVAVNLATLEGHCSISHSVDKLLPSVIGRPQWEEAVALSSGSSDGESEPSASPTGSPAINSTTDPKLRPRLLEL
jgi:hypothetical protein